jgi:hypothetical protein
VKREDVYDPVQGTMSKSGHPKLYKRLQSAMMFPDKYLDLFIGVYEKQEIP